MESYLGHQKLTTITISCYFFYCAKGVSCLVINFTSLLLNTGYHSSQNYLLLDIFQMLNFMHMHSMVIKFVKVYICCSFLLKAICNWSLSLFWLFLLSWFDKSLSLIMTRSGNACVNFEHAWGDGVAVLRYFNEVFNDSIDKSVVHPSTNVQTGAGNIRKLGKFVVTVSNKRKSIPCIVC